MPLPPLASGSHPYRGREVVLTSRHGKERVLGRPFRAALGMRLRIAEVVDTDSFGTFSGETPRPAGPAETCRLKALAGLEATGASLGLASEGSFGPHPLVPLLPVGREWMTFVDRERGLVIGEELLAPRTNFSHLAVSVSEQEGLPRWLERIGFPSHAVLVRAGGSAPEQAGVVVARGVRTAEDLRRALATAHGLSPRGCALLETDMRAHMNPTRMVSIRSLAFRLARRIATPCPACGTPGWGRVATVPGLPCGWCGEPTVCSRGEEHGCGVCGHRLLRPRPDGLERADPAHCEWCNP